MINIFLFSFFSSIYLFCAGIFFYSKKNIGASAIYLTIIFGAITLASIGVIFNFFTALSININTFIFLIITTFGCFFIFKHKIFFKLFYCCILISLISTLILYYDTIYRPDANLYHLPFTKIINDNKIILGISNIHFRFGHTSVLQYLNAIFNNHLFRDNGILLPAAIIFCSITLYFWNEINQNLKKDKIYSYYVFLALCFILYGYNRYSEFGNDTSAHLIFLLITTFFLKYKSFQEINDKEFFKLSLLSFFCFMLKTSLIFVFLFPIYVLISNYNKKYIFNYFNIFFFLIIISWFLKNILISGCFIYPVEITCFEKLEWFSNKKSYSISATLQSLDNQAWTKGWSNYKGSDVSQELFVRDFFWFKTWMSVHGMIIIKKLLIFIIIIFGINIFIKKNEVNNDPIQIQFNKKLTILILFSLLCSFIWFLRFPLFRYGSSYLVVLIISVSTFLAIKLNVIIENQKYFSKFVKFSLIIFFTLFISKHGVRIYKKHSYVNLNYTWPSFPKEKNTKKVSKIQKIGDFNYYLLKPNVDGCGYTSAPCTPYPVKNVKFKKIRGYKLLYLEK